MNIILGLFYHTLGSFSSGSFMAPYKKIKIWNFENYWIIMGLFAWIIAPWVLASITIPNLIQVLKNSPVDSLSYTFFFGFFWGIGAITFGLAIRYLGYGLGYSLTLGLSALIGTILPPIYYGTLISLFSGLAGLILFTALLVCIAGIAYCIKAGYMKDKEVNSSGNPDNNLEYNYKKGIIVALICGFFATFTGFGIKAGQEISELAVQNGASSLMKNNAVLIVMLVGGFLFNLIWYIARNMQKSILSELINSPKKTLNSNYFFSAVSGILWYLQYMFYGMGTTRMGRYDFLSWTIHMSLIIAFGNLWGLLFQEWKVCHKRTKNTVKLGIFLIILSTLLMGLSGYLVQTK
jgi:L-rhamnose-H+ transport protein